MNDFFPNLIYVLIETWPVYKVTTILCKKVLLSVCPRNFTYYATHKNIQNKIVEMNLLQFVHNTGHMPWSLCVVP
jgi:hypothetical protein